MNVSPKRMAGFVAGGVLVLGAVYTLVFLEPDNTPPPKAEIVRPARVFTVPDPGASVTRRFPGFVRGAKRVPLSFRVSGTLVELSVHEAAELAAGDVVAKLDPRDFESEIRQTRGQIDSAAAVLSAMEKGERDEVIRMLEAKVKAAVAARDQASTEYGRQQRLFEKSLISKSQLDRYKLAIDIAAEELTAAEEELGQARKGARQEDLDAQKARIDALQAMLKQAEDSLADTVLKAPFDGVVTRRYVENHEEIRGGDPIVQLQTFDLLEVVADFPESLMAHVRTEMVQGFRVGFDFNPGVSYEAKLYEVTAEADPRTSTYRVTARFDRPEDVRILPGMTATLSVVLDAVVDSGLRGHFIPADAVFTDAAGAPNVWRVDPASQRVTRVPVTVGEVLDGQIAVQTGLSTGDLVVTGGVHLLEPDQQVRPLVQAAD